MSNISEHHERSIHHEQPARPNTLLEEGAVYCDECGHKRSDRNMAGVLSVKPCPVCAP